MQQMTGHINWHGLDWPTERRSAKAKFRSSSSTQAPKARRHDHTASSSSRPIRQFFYRQNGRYVQHHGPPGRLPPRTRALRHDPRKAQPQMINKTTNSSPSVSSPPSSPVSVTPQAAVARRSLARLLPSTLHPRTRQTSFSTSPLLFCHPDQKEQGTLVTRDKNDQKRRIIRTIQSEC